jgi:predicted transcriptional regulator
MAKAVKRTPDWQAISDRYFKTDDSVRAIARSFGITEGAIRQHAQDRAWVRPTKPSEQDVGRLGSQLALCMISVDGVAKRARCFVRAMVALEAPIAEIAEALEISERALRAEFSRELNKA